MQDPNQPPSRAPLLMGWLAVVVFGGFCVAAAWMFVFGFAVPAAQCWRARNWVATPCRIEYSFKSVGKPPNDVLAYTYTFAGQTYTSHHYGFPALRQVRPHRQPSGATLQSQPQPFTGTCYVNPARPEEAVIDRQLQGSAAIGGLVALAWSVGLGWLTLKIARPLYRRQRVNA
jgi:hypothetical protein